MVEEKYTPKYAQPHNISINDLPLGVNYSLNPALLSHEIDKEHHRQKYEARWGKNKKYF